MHPPEGLTRAWVAGLGVLGMVNNAVEQPPAPRFQFESIQSLGAMQSYVTAHFKPGSDRETARKLFVQSGHATMIVHPYSAGVEKYLYDINLCAHYVWRWNISLDADAAGLIRQMYVNGEPVFPSGPQKPDADGLARSSHASIYRMHRERPEATEGEHTLTYLLLDADSNLATIGDQVLTGSGPSRPDPADLGASHVYTNVEPWRSIFDADSADRVVPYKPGCGSIPHLGAHAQ